MEIAHSVNDVPIRLTPERWQHIVENRDELAGRMDDVLFTIEQPDWVSKGYAGCLMAWKGYGRNRYLVVLYRELARSDGFVVTAFFTSKPKKGQKVWP